MRHHLRLALPPLADLMAGAAVAFVFVDKEGRIQRSGTALPAQLAEQAGNRPVYALLRADDAIVSQITLPPVPAARRKAAVLSSLEPMVLSDLAQLSVAYSPRSQDGQITVAWANREPLQRAWSLLAGCGLNLAAFIPTALVLPANDPEPDKPLGLPANERWLGPLPGWSLAGDELKPRSGMGRWRNPLCWTGAAAAVWLLGLNLYAASLDRQAADLQAGTQNAVKQAFPHIPIIIDPLRQVRNERNALRLAQGSLAEDDFMALAQKVAQVLEFARGHVKSVSYDGEALTLTLGEGYTPPGNEAAILQAASVQQLLIEKDPEQANKWQIRRLAAQGAQTGAPSS